MKKIAIFVIVLFLSLELFAQGKLFLEPYLGFFVGFSKENNNINDKQNIINHNYFGSKDLAAGGKVSYTKNKNKLSLGYETSYYHSNYQHRETGLPRIEGRYSTGYGPFNSIYIEYAKQLINFNVKMPHSFKKWIKAEDDYSYLISSKISPVLGIEYRFTYTDYVNDFNFPRSRVSTSQGNYYTDIEFLHLNKKANLTMRGGVNWEFYNGERHKITITLLYKFAFKDAGYIQYHFKSVNNINPEFDYQNTTRGNGFCIYLGLPIKLYTFKKK
ncbi:MAG: hypothetical protein LH615_03100 [Ferruginibacter sp.]|nr:hypothetical protein [Ferruginibacter sp.]